MLKTLLVTGATGKQGRAVISALHRHTPAPSFRILALTRSPNSPSARSLLSAFPSISLLAGNLDDCPAIFAAARKELGVQIDGVFSVQVPMGQGQTVQTEERQGRELVDASVGSGVRHFVYTSADRGGRERGDREATDVPHFASKFRVEKHLRERCAEDGVMMKYTILRPVAFMENFQPGMVGKLFGAMWKVELSEGRRLQFVSVGDVGVVAARAFEAPEEFEGERISLAGDEVSWTEAGEVWRRVCGKGMPDTFGVFGRALMWAVGDLGAMFRWMEGVGFGADVEGCRKRFGGFKGLGEWVGKKENGFMGT